MSHFTDSLSRVLFRVIYYIKRVYNILFPTTQILHPAVYTLVVTLLLTITAYTHQTSGVFAQQKPIVILHTNDVHGAIDNNIGYSGLDTYKKFLEERYGEENVILVDSGDAIQGSSFAMITKGEAIVHLMNAVGYDYITLGNHEFDYKLPQLFMLDDIMQAKIISTNFINLKTAHHVYTPYCMHTINNINIAFIGVTTPESILKGNSIFFQDADGNYLYSMAEDSTGQALYDIVQSTIDQAQADGADYVVALTHLGLEEAAKPWRSTDLIAHTTGIDLVLDGHSHSIIEGKLYKNLSGDDVLLAQTGAKLNNIGQIIIDPTNTSSPITATLIDKSTVESVLDQSKVTNSPSSVQELIDTTNAEFAVLLSQNIAHSDYPLIAYTTKSHEIRMHETNLGNFVADAYRILLQSDIAITSAGALRANIPQGDLTYQNIIDLHPFSNYIMSIYATGRQIRDALEMGAKSLPNPDPALIHVSGLTYTVDLSIPSSVQLDERGNFLSVNGAYRVRNIRINNEPIDLERRYSVASHDYLFKRGGDGLTMFQENPPLKDMFILDNQALIKYITESLHGNIGKEYAMPEGRIVITQ